MAGPVAPVAADGGEGEPAADAAAAVEAAVVVGEAEWLRASGAEALPYVVEAAGRCDEEDATACYRLANACEVGMGAPADMAHAQLVYDRACRAGYGLACERLAALRSWDSGPPKDEPLARELLGRACELGQLTACAELGRRFRFGQQAPADPVEAAGWYAKACAGGLRGACGALEWLRPELESADAAVPVVEPATTAATPPRPEQACPAAFHISMAAGGGPNLSGLAGIPGAELLAAIPESLDGWEAEGSRSAWNGGDAGHLSSGAEASFRAGDRVVSVLLVDMFMQCTVQPGTGAAMLNAEPAPAARLPFRAGEVAGLPARVITGPNGLTLETWIADRCEVGASAAPPATEADLRAVTEALDDEFLGRLCARRDVDRPPSITLPRGD